MLFRYIGIYKNNSDRANVGLEILLAADGYEVSFVLTSLTAERKVPIECFIV